MQTVITSIGKSAVLNSISTGVLIDIASVKVGSSIVTNLTDSITQIPDVVWTGSVNNMKYISNETGFTFVITLPEDLAIGTAIGCIGLYLRSGELFSASNFLAVRTKESTIEKVYISFMLNTGTDSIFETKFIMAEEVRLPSSTSINDLSTDFNAYVVTDVVSGITNPAIAVGLSTGNFSIIEGPAAEVISRPAGVSSALSGKLVGVASSGGIVLANNGGAIGFYTADSRVVNNCCIEIPDANFTPGSKYYCGAGGQFSLTGTQVVGVAVSSKRIWINCSLI